MVRIYISSTYSDLQNHRERAYHALRQMQHEAIAMEDYVAADQRPLEKCLNDVASCDLYIGIFAWRYGYIPLEGNPQRRSITELEYRKAVEIKKGTLIFLLDKQTPWPPTLMDQTTGEGDLGKSIAALRQELEREKLVSFFKTPDELVAKLAPAVYLWEKQHAQGDVLLSASRYYKAITDMHDGIAAALALFSDEKDIYPDQCEMIHEQLLVLYQPVKGLLDTVSSLPLRPSDASLRFPLTRALHSVEERINVLMPLIKSFQNVCRTASRRVIAQRGEIQRKLDTLVKNIGEVDVFYTQVAAALPNEERTASLQPGVRPSPIDSVETPQLVSLAVGQPDPSPASSVNLSTDITEPSGEKIIQLCTIMHKKYNRDDFEFLCTRFEKEYADLAGDGLPVKMLNFIKYCARNGKYLQLVAQMQTDYPDLMGKL